MLPYRETSSNVEEIRTTLPVKFPIKPKDVIIKPSDDRWKSIKNDDGSSKLRKVYSFDTLEQRSYYINELLVQERINQHLFDCLFMYNDQTNKYDVTIETYTLGIKSITEIDKKFAAFCDIVYHETIYNI